MLAVRQTWTLVQKTLTLVFLRHWLGTSIRAFFGPIVFAFILAYAKNFFVPPSNYGVGSATPLRSLSDAIQASSGGRNTVAIVNNGFTGGDIAEVINQVSGNLSANGLTVEILGTRADVLDVCPSTLRGVTPCFAAVEFNSSPSQGTGGVWNYTLRADGSFATEIFVDQTNNAAEIYALPLQHAIDAAIASLNGTQLTADVEQFPFTTMTQTERAKLIETLYMNSLIKVLGVAYFIGIVGICYQLAGNMAYERELGMSQLIEAMMPNRKRWVPQVVRLASVHIAFDILYFPSWVIMGGIVGSLNYPATHIGIPIGFFILAGFALSSWSVAFASLFKRAQLSGITVVIISIILAIIIQVIPSPSTAAAVVLAVLFPPINFTLYILYNAYWQRLDEGAVLSKPAPGFDAIPKYRGPNWQFPGYVFFIICVLQFLIYPIVGMFIERALYGTASQSRKLSYSSEATPETVKVSALSKHYPPGWFSRTIWSRFSKKQTVRAVDDVSFSVLRGQIMVLLGANGSGKSTTLDTLAGLQKPTSGLIELDATGGLGLCPQKNVLWNELTVQEHVKIFNRLKATTVATKTEVEEMVAACDLDQKLNARSETLSGGQKRKCQLAMAMTGGSSVCLLDEISSGLDPLSRRKIWDIIIAERGKRSMLLTTHFLDEADLLSDDITILSKGKLVAHGSSVELKHDHGKGYRVVIYNENMKTLPDQLERATTKQVYHDQTVYSLASSAAAAGFVAELERQGVSEYQVNGPTIEDVFLKLAEEVKDELEVEVVPKSVPSSSDVSEDGVAVGNDLQLLPGRELSFLAQSWVLFRKRTIILKHNKWPYVIALILPIITAGLVTLFLGGLPQLTCAPSAQVSSSRRVSIQGLARHNSSLLIPQGPEVDVTFLDASIPDLASDAPFQPVADYPAFAADFAANYSTIVPGGLYAGAGNAPTFAWIGPGLSYAVVAQNLMDISLLKIPIHTSYQSFDLPGLPSYGDSLQFVVYFGLAMSAFPGFFALYTNSERLRNVRALHYSNGVRAGPLWLAYISFDFIIVLLVSAISVAIFVGASSVFYGPGYLFVVFFLYGLSATLMAYLISLFTSSQLATFAFAAGGQCAFFLIYFLVDLLLITFTEASSIDSNTRIAQYTMGLFFPSGNMLRALLLSLNQFSLLCQGATTIPSYPGDFNVYGCCILYLILQCAAQLLALVAFESGWKPSFFARSVHKPIDEEEIEDVDAEVFAEAARLDHCADQLQVKHASKSFGPNYAVQDVSFGVPHGETFALLGPNGAGKSTTINLIRGDMKPSEKTSEILIENISIISHRAVARVNLGVTPQFDAMDQMTAIEHLQFYARARGVADVDHNVEKVIDAVGLRPFKTRMAGKLSGGNKRKLSLAISLMGNPSVLILDEPSSGMDAASKRVMWKTLRAVSAGRSLVITTHSMEEADALADRAGIMAKRMLAIGTSNELRKKHGDAYHVHVVHKNAPHSTQGEMDAIKSWVRQNFPRAITEDRVFHGQLRFSVPNDRTVEKGVASKGGISSLFSQLEAAKQELGFEYYSVSQATLDQVFLNIVNRHNVLEENYAKTHVRQISAWDRARKGISTVYHNA